MFALSGGTQQVLSVVKHLRIKATQIEVWCISQKIKKELHTIDSLELCNIFFKFVELLIQRVCLCGAIEREKLSASIKDFFQPVEKHIWAQHLAKLDLVQW